jgi:IS30 family transposase
MTKYREILRLKALGLSQQNIADSCSVSKKTVNRVLKRAKELDIAWPLDGNETDAVLAEKFFPSAKPVASNKRMPDYACIRKELLRNGVSKKLLWTEYMEDCRANGDEPLMYSWNCQEKCSR